MLMENHLILNILGAVFPRGHVLDLLFLFYLNDMPYALKQSKTTMHADDASLAYSARCVSDISNAMN